MSRIYKFFSQRGTSLEQFPIAHVLLVFLTVLSIINIYFGYDATLEAELTKLIIASIFALPLTLIPGVLHWITKKNTGTSQGSANSVVERHIPLAGTSKKKTVISASFSLQILMLIAGVVYYILLPNNFDNILFSTRVEIIGSIILAYLLVFLGIARTKKNNEAFTWMWRKEVIASVLIGGLAGLIIRLGISACIKSIEFLFDVKFSTGNIYQYVAAISMIFITGAITLLNFSNQQNETPVYTRVHRIFGHYIFLPLTIIYGLILISYGIKIIATGIRPTGTIIYMVMGYIAFGLLTRLTTYPALPNSFVSKSHLILFVSFLLTSLLMIPAIQMRIEQYGLTFARYIVGAIIVWVILFSIGGIFFRKYRMVIIISTLVLLGGFILYGGDLNVNNMSANSQKKHLLSILKEHDISLPLNTGSLQNLSNDQKKEILEPLKYLVSSVDTSRLQNILSQKDLISIEVATASYQKEGNMCNAIGLKSCDIGYNTRYEDPNKIDFNFFTKKRPASMTISGYSMLYNFNCENGKNIVRIDNALFDFTPYISDIYLHASKNENNYMQPEQTKEDSIAISSEIDNSYTIENNNIKIVLYSMDGKQIKNADESTSYSIEYCEGIALVK